MERFARIAAFAWVVCAVASMFVYMQGLRFIYLEVSPWLAGVLALLTLGLFAGIALLRDTRQR